MSIKFIVNQYLLYDGKLQILKELTYFGPACPDPAFE